MNKELRDMDAVQKWIEGWNADIFSAGVERAMPLAVHIAREAKELDIAIHCSEGATTNEVRHEAADIFILLCALCGSYGFSLLEAVKEKMAINDSRTWKAPDEQGVIEHE